MLADLEVDRGDDALDGGGCVGKHGVARQQIAQTQVGLLPERIEFVEVMPYTAAQKLNKTALKQDIAQKLAAEAAARLDVAPSAVSRASMGESASSRSGVTAPIVSGVSP